MARRFICIASAALVLASCQSPSTSRAGAGSSPRYLYRHVTSISPSGPVAADTSKLVVSFDGPLDFARSSNDHDDVLLYGAADGPASIWPTLSTDKTQLNLWLTNQLTGVNGPARIVINKRLLATGQIDPKAGVSNDEVADVSIAFDVAPQQPVAPVGPYLIVMDVTPADGTVGVLPGADVIVRFNAPLTASPTALVANSTRDGDAYLESPTQVTMVATDDRSAWRVSASALPLYGPVFICIEDPVDVYGRHLELPYCNLSNGPPGKIVTHYYVGSPDDPGPTVLSTTPAAGTVGIQANQPVQFSFDKALFPASVTSLQASFTAGDDWWAQIQVPAVATLSADAKTLTFTPQQDFPEGVLVTPNLSGPIRDVGGAPLTHLDGTWRVAGTPPDDGPPPDTTPPSVVSLVLAPSSTTAGTYAVTVKFSEPISAESVNRQSIFTVGDLMASCDNGPWIESTLSLGADQETVTVQLPPLSPGQTVNVFIYGVSDLAGNALEKHDECGYYIWGLHTPDDADGGS